MNRAFDQWCNNIEKRPALAAIASILWLALVSGVAFFWHLGSIGLIDETEPLFAEASRQMLVRGDWITPFFNDETRFDKPALIYWCQALAYSILGVNEWAVRLPSALAATAVIGFTFYTLYWYQSKKDELEGVSRPGRRWFTASLGAALASLNPETIVWARTGVSDMLLTGCMVCALFCFFLGYATQHQESQIKASFLPSRWYTGFYILIAGAILTKGPVGIVLPGLIVGTFLIYVGKLRELREMRLLPGILIITVISAPWYVLVTWRNGWNFINSFFGYHNVERFTSVVNRHSAPWFFYFLVVLLGFAPYSVYLPSAMQRLKFWQPSYWRNQSRSQQFSIFALIWFFVIFGFFTIAVTKLPSYVLPLMPAAAILIALLWSDLLEASNIKKAPPTPLLRISGWVNVAFASIIAVAMFYLPKIIGNDSAAPNFRQLIQQSGLTVGGGIIWLLCAIVLCFLLLRQHWLAVIGVNLTAFTAFLLLVLTPALFIMDSERQLPLRKLAAIAVATPSGSIAVQNQQPQEELIMVGFKKPTVTFYTQRTINYIKLNETASDYIQNQAVKKPQSSVMVLAQPNKFPKMGLKPTDYQILGDSGAYQLIRVPPKRGVGS